MRRCIRSADGNIRSKQEDTVCKLPLQHFSVLLQKIPVFFELLLTRRKKTPVLSQCWSSLVSVSSMLSIYIYNALEVVLHSIKRKTLVTCATDTNGKTGAFCPMSWFNLRTKRQISGQPCSLSFQFLHGLHFWGHRLKLLLLRHSSSLFYPGWIIVDSLFFPSSGLDWNISE